MDYLDFELQIGSGNGQTYPVSVVHSPAGEAHEIMRFPFDDLALEGHLKDLQIALLRSGGTHRRVLSPEEKVIQDFGHLLFDALFTDEVRNRYDVSQQIAMEQDKGLRLELRIQPPELGALPWEFMYDSRQAEYVCLHRSTPVVRYPELPQPIKALAVTQPLRILGMIVSPSDLPPLNIDSEKQRVEQATQILQMRGLVELTWLTGQTWRDLQKAMRGGPWHVYHFIGHGGFDSSADEGLISLANESGQAYYLHATQLARLLGDHHSLRLVLLNSCEGARTSRFDIFSSIAATLVRRGIPAVLAMQYGITDRAAIEFSHVFYETLADGLPVDAATTEARKAVSIAIPNTVEWGIPALYMRSPNGILFSIRLRKEVEGRQTEVELPPQEHRERREHQLELSLPDEQAVPMSEVVRAYYDHLQYLYEHRGDAFGIPTGFADIDKLLAGLQRGNLIIVAARPGVGKISLLLSICLNVARKFQQHVVIFSLDMSSKEIVQRFISHEAGIDSLRLRYGDIHEEEWDHFIQASSALSDVPLYIDDTPSISVSQLRTKAQSVQSTEFSKINVHMGHSCAIICP